MLNCISASTIGEAWILAIETVLANGTEIDDDKGRIVEYTPLFIEIVEPVLDDKIIDVYGDKKHLTFLDQNFNDLTEIEEWGYSYAQRLYDYNGINQITRVIEKLQANFFSKSATISLFQAGQDLIHTPCLVSLDFKIRNSKLLINSFFRSQDVGNKMYGDALELLKLANRMLEELPATGIIMTHTICSAHIYSTDIKKLPRINK